MTKKMFCLPALLLAAGITATAQTPPAWKALAQRPSTLGLEKGMIDINTAPFHLKLVKASQTIAAMEPKGGGGFDFTPADKLGVRAKDSLYHLGDITLRLRSGSETAWKSYSTAVKRAPVTALGTGGTVLAAADLAGTLPADIPVQIKRYWELIDGQLVMRFEVRNKTTKPVEIGALGIPMIFNNILQDKTLDQAHKSNVFFDPYIGQDAGYLQVIRLHGKGPVMVVVPYGNTPFEAYNPLLADPTPREVTFEGFHEWMVHSKAYAEQEWKDATPWNTPTSFTLKPGETRSYGVKFLLTDAIRNIENKLIENKRPVAVGIPGYVIPEDETERLFLHAASKVKSVAVAPQGALVLTETAPTANGWRTYNVNAKTWGRARVTITYDDGNVQTIQYKVIKPETKVMSDYGHFLTTNAWYEDTKDPFKRAPSVMTYDYEKKAIVKEDRRAWIAGLSDEGGAGGWLGAIMKQFVQPDKQELVKLQRFMHETVWGRLQYSEGPRKYGVRKSMFYYAPDSMPAGTYSKDIDYKTWSAWTRKEAESTIRSYNYPHVAAAHWVLYRLARNHVGLVTEKSWDWYLSNAFNTAVAMVEQAPQYAQYGQMEGTIFLLILKDLKNEGMNDMARKLEAVMKKRADLWRTLSYPFGSEMPWDSTGQEEVYIWSKYFGYNDKAAITLNAVLAYMPTIPHWGYNGSARRYWDFVYGGKLSRIERQLHHYGSGLNAIPVLTDYRDHPDDLYMLRVGYGGLMGTVANITKDGYGPAAFHSFPSTLKIDGISGDYGSGFFGYAINSATYIANHKEFGWLAFGGNLSQKDNKVTVKIEGAAKSRIYIAPAGLWITLDAGTFNTVVYDAATGQVGIALDAADAYTPKAYLRIEQPANKQVGTYGVAGNVQKERGAYVIPLGKSFTTVSLRKVK